MYIRFHLSPFDSFFSSFHCPLRLAGMGSRPWEGHSLSVYAEASTRVFSPFVCLNIIYRSVPVNSEIVSVILPISHPHLPLSQPWRQNPHSLNVNNRGRKARRIFLLMASTKK
jgi:hypothetical protein